MINTNNFVDKEQFAKRLQELFEKTERKAVELETKLKVGRATVSRWRNGHTIPNNSQIQEIADFFGVRYEWLIGRDDDEPNIGEMEVGKAIKKSKAFPIYMETLGYSFSLGDYIFDDEYFKNESCLIQKKNRKTKITWEQYHRLRKEVESFIDFKISELF